jgi:hypothetical protein
LQNLPARNGNSQRVTSGLSDEFEVAEKVWPNFAATFGDGKTQTTKQTTSSVPAGRVRPFPTWTTTWRSQIKARREFREIPAVVSWTIDFRSVDRHPQLCATGKVRRRTKLLWEVVIIWKVLTLYGKRNEFVLVERLTGAWLLVPSRMGMEYLHLPPEFKWWFTRKWR